jgi:copper chaperone
MKLHVPDMSCGHCTAAITKSLHAEDAAATVVTDLARREVSVETVLAPEEVIATLRTAGYGATLM